MSESRSEVTQLLDRWRAGETEAQDLLMPIVYGELRRLAQHHLRGESRRGEMQTTALVHEAYLRLVGVRLRWQDRSHFYAAASGAMRRVLVEEARRRKAAKRGGGAWPETLERLSLAVEADLELLDLDQALRDLTRFDARKAKAVELRYFGGLALEEIATVLGISRATVERDLVMARAWLARQLGQSGAA